MAEHECFSLADAVVHGDPDMSTEVRDALAVVIDAARAHLAAHPDTEREARYLAGQQRIRERNARLLAAPTDGTTR